MNAFFRVYGYCAERSAGLICVQLFDEDYAKWTSFVYAEKNLNVDAGVLVGGDVTLEALGRDIANCEVRRIARGHQIETVAELEELFPRVFSFGWEE